MINEHIVVKINAQISPYYEHYPDWIIYIRPIFSNNINNPKKGYITVNDSIYPIFMILYYSTIRATEPKDYG